MAERHFTRIGWRDAVGTGKVGELSSSWSAEELTDVFGPPEDTRERSDGKTTMEWRLRFDDGSVATIYDWHGFHWSIGGRGLNVPSRVEALLIAHSQPDELTAAEMYADAADGELAEAQARIAKLRTQLRILGHKPVA